VACCMLLSSHYSVMSIDHVGSHFTFRQPIECLRPAQDTTVRRKNADEQAADQKADDSGSAAMAGRRTLDSLGAADSVVDAMDLAAAETDRLTAAAAAATGSAGAKAAAATLNPLMLGLSPAAYVLRAVQVRASSIAVCLSIQYLQLAPPVNLNTLAASLTL